MNTLKKPKMKKRFSGIVLAMEIAAIIMLHTFKLNHQDKIDKLQKHDAVSRQANITLGRSYSFSNLK